LQDSIYGLFSRFKSGSAFDIKYPYVTPHGKSNEPGGIREITPQGGRCSRALAEGKRAGRYREG
jgi:hypothetical protein